MKGLNVPFQGQNLKKNFKTLRHSWSKEKTSASLPLAASGRSISQSKSKTESKPSADHFKAL